MEDVRVSTELADVDVDLLCDWLAEAYWSRTRSRETIERSLSGSLCFSAHAEGRMVGFARVVTDFATFAWLCDVVVDPGCRGRGVGVRLVSQVMEHPELQTVRWMLGTRDAHSLYERFGFATSTEPDRWMTKGFASRF